MHFINSTFYLWVFFPFRIWRLQQFRKSGIKAGAFSLLGQTAAPQASSFTLSNFTQRQHIWVFSFPGDLISLNKKHGPNILRLSRHAVEKSPPSRETTLCFFLTDWQSSLRPPSLSVIRGDYEPVRSLMWSAALRRVWKHFSGHTGPVFGQTHSGERACTERDVSFLLLGTSVRLKLDMTGLVIVAD